MPPTLAHAKGTVSSTEPTATDVSTAACKNAWPWECPVMVSVLFAKVGSELSGSDRDPENYKFASDSALIIVGKVLSRQRDLNFFLLQYILVLYSATRASGQREVMQP